MFVVGDQTLRRSCNKGMLTISTCCCLFHFIYLKKNESEEFAQELKKITSFSLCACYYIIPPRPFSSYYPRLLLIELYSIPCWTLYVKNFLPWDITSPLNLDRIGEKQRRERFLQGVKEHRLSRLRVRLGSHIIMDNKRGISSSSKLKEQYN